MVFFNWRIGLLAAVLAGPGTMVAGSPLDEAVNILGQWVETERLISRSQAEWETNRASMQNLIEVYQQEIEALDALITDAEEDTSAAERRRAELLQQDGGIREVETRVVAGLIEAEKQLKDLHQHLPPPLQDELRPLFNMLPADPAASRVAIAQRVQPIVAILTQIQRFNQVVTLVEDFREFEAGRTVQTESVWFGLGAAYYVDSADQHAGFAVLGDGGWSWQDDPSLVPLVREFINIYRGTKQASYVKLPVTVK